MNRIVNTPIKRNHCVLRTVTTHVFKYFSHKYNQGVYEMSYKFFKSEFTRRNPLFDGRRIYDALHAMDSLGVIVYHNKRIYLTCFFDRSKTFCTGACTCNIKPEPIPVKDDSLSEEGIPFYPSYRTALEVLEAGSFEADFIEFDNKGIFI